MVPKAGSQGPWLRGLALTVTEGPWGRCREMVSCIVCASLSGPTN
jgi:hypothetical protein